MDGGYWVWMHVLRRKDSRFRRLRVKVIPSSSISISKELYSQFLRNTLMRKVSELSEKHITFGNKRARKIGD